MADFPIECEFEVVEGDVVVGRGVGEGDGIVAAIFH